MANTVPGSRAQTARWPIVVAAIATLALIVVTFTLTRPLPPKTVIMATGPQGGAYDTVGQRYREFFARHRITLELKATNGSVDNIGLLKDPRSGVSVTLAQNGITNRTESPGLVSLGTLFYEPLWFFSGVGPLRSPKDVEKMRFALGLPGSGTYKVGRNVLALLGLRIDRMTLREMGVTESGEALLRGDLDFVGMSQPWDAEIIQRLLRDPRIEPISWARADAHVALRPFLSKKILPRGVADLANDLPRSDVTLVASKASLIVRNDLHPALQHLFLEAASEIHSSPGVFNRAGEFPAAEPIDLPLSNIARDYYRSGKPFLQRYLPFWLAAFTGRLLVLLIPIIGIAYPLFRLLPALYGWSMRRRILRLYGELKFIEAELEINTSAEPTAAIERLDHLERRANRMRVPVTFTQMLYTLKQHIVLVRGEIPKPASQRQTTGQRPESLSQ
ncbi:MAG: C4-dicarboxylate ABC transporter substrate-binding protein [Betaproteobacteria bacterium]|nr:MAG: C4-dicarboxylate ABC transporter substrate-binding protein [Betaproteobacteria bacterium]